METLSDLLYVLKKCDMLGKMTPKSLSHTHSAHTCWEWVNQLHGALYLVSGSVRITAFLGFLHVIIMAGLIQLYTFNPGCWLSSSDPSASWRTYAQERQQNKKKESTTYSALGHFKAEQLDFLHYFWLTCVLVLVQELKCQNKGVFVGVWRLNLCMWMSVLCMCQQSRRYYTN